MLEATALPNETESLPIDLNTVYHRDQTLEKIDCCTLGKAKTKACSRAVVLVQLTARSLPVPED